MRLSKFLAPIAVVALLVGFSAPALGQNPGGDVPGRPEIKEDGKACFDAAAANPAITCTVLYGHLFNLLDPVPINVQFPHEDCVDLDRGFTSVPTVGPFDQAKQDLYSSPGFVEYSEGSISENGICDPRLHPERGITSDVEIDTSIPIMFYWYMSADTDDVSLAADPREVNTGAMPCLEVTVILQTGRHFGQGTELARGTATRTVASSKVAPAQDTPVPDPCVDEKTAALYPNIEVAPVHEFPVNLGAAGGNIPKVEAFVVHIEWRQFSATGQKFAQREWNVHTGVEYRNRLVVPVLNPQRVEEVRPQLFEDKIYIHGVFNSPWGSYDVDPASLKVEIIKPDGSVFESQNMGEPILKFSVDHDAHFKPVNATFPWDYKKDNLPAGQYKIRMTSQNWQHTATATNEATVDFPSGYAGKPRGIRITSSEGILQRNIVGKGVKSGGGPGIDVEGGADKGLPGFEGPLVLAALLGAAAVAMRRRKD